MSAEPRPRSTSPSTTRHLVATVRGHGVEVAAEQDAAVAPELGAHDDVVRHAVDGERRRALAQALLDEIGELGLVVALRRHRDQRGGELEQVGRVRREDPPTEGWLTSRRRGRAGCR